MSIIEKQSTLGRSIVEINTNTVKELATLQRENIEQYFQTNQEFGQKLPEVTDIATFVSLQREYGETLWNNAKTAVKTHNGIVQSAFNETREAITLAFSAEQTADDAEKPAKAKTKAASKAKTKAAA
ncbi:MAG: phasin family protein [Pseudomonadales bacterium]